MSWELLADVAGLLFLFLGAVLCLTSAIGLLRLPNLFLRMHSGSKPQVLGVLLVLLGVGLRVRSGLDVGMLVLVGIFQMLTIPVSSHLISRAQYRMAQPPPEGIVQRGRLGEQTATGGTDGSAAIRATPPDPSD